MPVHKEGKGCYQYGNSGKKYCGKSAVAKAYAQAKAIEMSQKKQGKPVE